MLKKRGQVTVFIILGLIMMLSFVMVTLLTKETVKRNQEPPEAAVVHKISTDPIQNYLENCLQEVTEEGIYLISNQGGYLQPEGDETPDLGSEAEWYDYYYENGRLPFLLDGEEITLRSKEEMQEALSRYILKKSQKCFEELAVFEEQGFSLRLPESSSEMIKAEVIINDDKVQVQLELPLEAARGEKTTQYNLFQTESELRLGTLRQVAQDVMQAAQEEQELNLQEFLEEYLPEKKLDDSINIYVEQNPYTQEYLVRIVDNRPVREGKKPETFQFAVKNVELQEEWAKSYEDEDRDGVPDPADGCPGSASFAVDDQGCDCAQITCSGSSCQVQDFQPRCVQGCGDGIKNQEEEGIDCGGPCHSCRKKFRVRLDLPLYEKGARLELANRKVDECTDCRECGCPEGFSCGSGGACTIRVSMQGKKCKTQDVFYSFTKIDCHARGPSWIEEDKNQLIKYEVGGIASKVPILNSYIEDKVKERFDQVTLCVNTEDLGCFAGKVRCFGENQLTPENKEKASRLIQGEVQKQVNENIPGFVDLFLNIDFEVDLSSFRLDLPYDCADKTIDSRKSCQALVKNGDSSVKADLLFIGDGYATQEELQKAVVEMADYDGANFGTENQGLFSERIFQENREKFNIWFMDTSGELRYGKDNYQPSAGKMPLYKDIISISSRCPWYDYIMVLSKAHQFRSNCMLGSPGPCRVSLAGENYPGRLVAHEFGHGFASLADEYYNFVKRKKIPQRFEQFFAEFQTGPNCRSSSREAESAWSGFDTGRFEGCGGDCGEECGTFLRPTFNSVMRHQNRNCEGGTCYYGPPYNEFYAVNEREIKKEMEKYS